jgi:hypothetical protein
MARRVTAPRGDGWARVAGWGAAPVSMAMFGRGRFAAEGPVSSRLRGRGACAIMAWSDHPETGP